MPLTSRQSRPRGSQLPDRLLGRLSPADSGGATLHRQGSDLPDRAGQQQHPPLSRPFSSPLQGYLARPSHGRLVAQAPAPSNAAGKLPPPSRSISIYLCVNVSKKLGRQSWLTEELFEPAEVGCGIAAEPRPQYAGVPTALEAG